MRTNAQTDARPTIDQDEKYKMKQDEREENLLRPSSIDPRLQINRPGIDINLNQFNRRLSRSLSFQQKTIVA